MSDLRFWRFSFLVFVLALFYVGYGLHGTDPLRLPQLANTAVGGDVAAFTADDKAGHRIVTTSEDGTVIYVGHISKGGNALRFYGKSSAD